MLPNGVKQNEQSIINIIVVFVFLFSAMYKYEVIISGCSISNTPKEQQPEVIITFYCLIVILLFATKNLDESNRLKEDRKVFNFFVCVSF